MTENGSRTHKRRLTAKQERFAQIVVGESKNHTVAYRLAYDCEGASAGTVWSNAHRVANSTVVAARIETLLEQSAAAAGITPTFVLANVAGIAVEAREKEDFGPAIRANELLGRHVGLFQEHSTVDVRVEHTLDDATREDLRAMLADLQNQRLAIQASAEVIDVDDAGQSEEDEPEASVLADEEEVTDEGKVVV